MNGELNQKTAVALGSFDGLHTGHMTVIASALEMRASGLFPLVLLFDEHPQRLLGGAPAEIMQKKKRLEVLGGVGIASKEIAFKEIYNMSCADFFNRILIEKLKVGAVCCGESYRFGRSGCGDCEALAALCAENGVQLKICPTVTCGDAPVSSTRIRRAIEAGDIKAANAMLGREFCYEYVVVSGDRRGRLIGAPTINQVFDSGFIVPRFGVYASETVIDGAVLPGVTNIGVRPTFNKNELRSETHIIGFSGDLYGRSVEVRLLDRIRDELRFDSMEALAGQIARDIEFSEKVYSERRKDCCV